MSTTTLFIILSLLYTSNAHIHPDVGLTPIQVIPKYGYPLEVHTIETEDGYLLETYRIPYGVNNASTVAREPVLVVHGLTGTAAVSLTLGPGSSIGFVLADEGYDVWLANYRGTTFSRKHKTLDSVANKKEFFDFSFQDVGFYDLTASIDYILNVTSHEKLFYIGHSQGTTSFFAMATGRPEYNDKIKLMTALAPVAYGKIEHVLYPLVKSNLPKIQEMSENLQIYEIATYQPYYALLGQLLCNDDAITQPLCELVIFFLAGYSSNFNKTVLPVITSNAPGGASSRMFFHYVQLGIAEDFQMYDFGETENMNRYGQASPPKFDLSKISAPVAIYHAENDPLSTERDVELLTSMLPNVVKKHYIKGYNHFDFLFAKNIDTELNNHLLETMKLYH